MYSGSSQVALNSGILDWTSAICLQCLTGQKFLYHDDRFGIPPTTHKGKIKRLQWLHQTDIRNLTWILAKIKFSWHRSADINQNQFYYLHRLYMTRGCWGTSWKASDPGRPGCSTLWCSTWQLTTVWHHRWCLNLGKWFAKLFAWPTSFHVGLHFQSKNMEWVYAWWL